MSAKVSMLLSLVAIMFSLSQGSGAQSCDAKDCAHGDPDVERKEKEDGIALKAELLQSRQTESEVGIALKARLLRLKAHGCGGCKGCKLADNSCVSVDNMKSMFDDYNDDVHGMPWVCSEVGGTWCGR